MTNFKIIEEKLEQFIRRYYTNELLKGGILFFAIGLLYFLFTLFIEYILWLNPTARTFLFWIFIAVEFFLFLKFIVWPIAKLFKLQKGIDFTAASKLIGAHFPEVGDKLLNVLQLKQAQDINSEESELLAASIAQKSDALQPIPFKLAINFKHSLKYLKYAAIPLLVILLSYITGYKNWFSDSYDRVVNYNMVYEAPAPFQFFILNDNLEAIENKPFELLVKTTGRVVPDQVQIQFNNQTYYLQQTAVGEFRYQFQQPKTALDFSLIANAVRSKPYRLDVVKVPMLLNFEMLLDYPSYTQIPDETLKSNGSLAIPEGTEVTWRVRTQETDKVALYAIDTTVFKAIGNGNFDLTKRIFSNLDYSITTTNDKLKDYERLDYAITVIKDAYPDLQLQMIRDSIDGQSLYFKGQISDDYGLSKLELVYYPVSEPDKIQKLSLPVVSGSYDEFVTAFPNQLSLEAGLSYELFFQVFDNDAINGSKLTKSRVFTYRKSTSDEDERQQLNLQEEQIKDLGKTFENLKSQEKELSKLSKTQKEKEALSFNDKKKLENFLKRQKEQEQMMQNFNKQTKENLENFQKDNEKNDPFKESLKQRLEEQEAQLKKDEQLLKELEDLKDKLQKEELSEKLEQLAKQNKGKQKSVEQILELTKRYYVAKKAERLMQELQQLGEAQDQLSKAPISENNKQAQEELNKAFDEIQKQMDALSKDNEALRKPMPLGRDEPIEDAIQEDQKGAVDDLDKHQKSEDENQDQNADDAMKSAQKKQKDAAKKMKQMSAKMSSSMMSGGSEQLEEDAAMLRQILDNLVLFSFDQEELMLQFKSVQINHNTYGSLLRKQRNLKEHFEHVDDSLFALSLRQPMLSELITTKITDVYYNIDKALDQLSENMIYQGVAAQQYAMTATNDLAHFLSDVLDNMETDLNMGEGEGEGKGSGSGQGGSGGMQLPDIIMSQEELNKQMQEGLDKQQKGESGEGESGEGKDGESGAEGSEGSEGKEGQSQGDGDQNSEEMNGLLYEIYQEQQKLREALEKRLEKDGIGSEGKQLLKQMENIELDLINRGFTNQTLQRMKLLQQQLIKLENATYTQGEEDRREAITNLKTFSNDVSPQIKKAKEYFNSIEILNRQVLPLHQLYKRKVQEYFK